MDHPDSELNTEVDEPQKRQPKPNLRFSSLSRPANNFESQQPLFEEQEDSEDCSAAQPLPSSDSSDDDGESRTPLEDILEELQKSKG